MKRAFINYTPEGTIWSVIDEATVGAELLIQNGVQIYDLPEDFDMRTYRVDAASRKLIPVT